MKSRVNRLLLPARVRYGYAGRDGYVMLVALVLIALLAIEWITRKTLKLV